MTHNMTERENLINNLRLLGYTREQAQKKIDEGYKKQYDAAEREFFDYNPRTPRR